MKNFIKKLKISEVNLRCVKCDKVIEPLEPLSHNTPAEYAAYNDAGVDAFAVGYGSAKYDTTEFIIGICDNCLEILHKSGAIAKQYCGLE